jgi:hypothetical protein
MKSEIETKGFQNTGQQQMRPVNVL